MEPFLPKPSHFLWPLCLTAAVLSHGLVGITLSTVEGPKPKPHEPVKIQIAPKKPKPVQEEPPPEKPLEPAPPPPKPKPAPQKLAKPNNVAKPAEKIRGLTPDSFATQGSGPSFSAGNTLDPEAPKKAVPLDQIPELPADEDLSAEARLISYDEPKYTDEANDVGLKMKVLADVYLDKDGQVLEVELPRKIGYGMDAQIIEVLRKAKFSPRKNRKGQGIPGWKTVPFDIGSP